MDMEIVRRESLKRQLADILRKLDENRDAALTHEMLQLSSAMVGYVGQYMRGQTAADETVQQMLQDTQLKLAQTACDMYAKQKAQMDQQEQAVAAAASQTMAKLEKQRASLRKAVESAQRLHADAARTEMEARRTELQTRAMASRSIHREG